MDFTAQVPTDRSALLLDAAARLDRLAGHLGEGDAAVDPFSDLLRDLSEDRAEFAAYPDLRPLPAVDRVAVRGDALGLQDRYSFWWLRLPLLLFPRRNWSFSRLEVRIEFSPEETLPERRPKVVDILPNRRFATVMTAGASVNVEVGADGHFAVDVPAVSAGVPYVGTAAAGAGASAKAGVSGSVGFGPVRLRAVAAKVDHTAEGLPKVFWRLDGSEFFQESQPELVVVLQVPQEVRTATVVGVLQAYRRFNMFPAGLQSAIRELPEALRVFFRQGAPLAAQASYELALTQPRSQEE